MQNVGNFGSAAVMNQKMNHAMTGSEIAALGTNVKKAGMQILCTVSESGFFANHLYIIAADNTSIIDLGLRPHTHTSALDGGFMFLIDRQLQGVYYRYQNLAPTAGIFSTGNGTGGGGSVFTGTGDNTGAVAETGATSGGYGTMSISGVSISWGWPSSANVMNETCAMHSSNKNCWSTKSIIGSRTASSLWPACSAFKLGRRTTVALQGACRRP